MIIVIGATNLYLFVYFDGVAQAIRVAILPWTAANDTGTYVAVPIVPGAIVRIPRDYPDVPILGAAVTIAALRREPVVRDRVYRPGWPVVRIPRNGTIVVIFVPVR
jgi:hypothetical protein